MPRVKGYSPGKRSASAARHSARSASVSEGLRLELGAGGKARFSLASALDGAAIGAIAPALGFRLSLVTCRCMVTLDGVIADWCVSSSVIVDPRDAQASGQTEPALVVTA